MNYFLFKFCGIQSGPLSRIPAVPREGHRRPLRDVLTRSSKWDANGPGNYEDVHLIYGFIYSSSIMRVPLSGNFNLLFIKCIV